MIMQHAVDGGAGDAVGAGKLAEALAALAVSQDGGAIEIDRRPSDVLAL
jgi:hypothetical protein